MLVKLLTIFADGEETAKTVRTLENVLVEGPRHSEKFVATREGVQLAIIGTWDDNLLKIDALGVRIAGRLLGDDRVAGEYGEWLLEF